LRSSTLSRWVACHRSQPVRNARALVCLSHQMRYTVLQNWLLRDVSKAVYLYLLLHVSRHIKLFPPFLPAWYTPDQPHITTRWAVLLCKQGAGNALVRLHGVVNSSERRQVYRGALDELEADEDKQGVARLKAVFGAEAQMALYGPMMVRGGQRALYGPIMGSPLPRHP
jgi:hypothetical protein